MNIAPSRPIVKVEPVVGLSRNVPPFAALRAFEAVGRTGGLRRAAQSLRVDHAVVSRHVRSLETRLGVALVDRLQSGGRLTAEGQQYYRRIAAAFAELNAATDDLMRTDESVRLKIWSVHGIASQWLAHQLGTFCAQHPNLDIELQPTDASPNFAAREADADIRYLYGETTPEENNAGVRSIEIARPDVTAVASPAFLAECGPIAKVADLLKLPVLHKKHDGQWRRWMAIHGVDCEENIPGLRLWHNDITVEAARKGQGIALANMFLIDDDLKSGRLVNINPSWCTPMGAYHFVTRADRWREPPIVALRRWLQQAMQLQPA